MRVIIYAQGQFAGEYSKLALGVLRFSTYDIVGVVDSSIRGNSVKKYFPDLPSDVMIYASIEDTLEFKPEAMIIGIAPKGGMLPEEWKSDLLFAIRYGLSIYSGLHFMLNSDELLSKEAKRCGVKLWDVRDVPKNGPVGTGKVMNLNSNIVLTVGTDCKIGKMTASIIFDRALKKRKINSVFIPTGQIGILIEGYGLAIDRVIGDFMSGTTEELIMKYGKDADVISVEGQGSLFHIGYSGVTMGLIHGALPQYMILCHEPSRKYIKESKFEIPDLKEAIRVYEDITPYYRKAKVIGIALNCRDLSIDEARLVIKETEEYTGLPTNDPVKFGMGNIVDSFIKQINKRGKNAT
ncbi:MAG: DUF1611 domain-containing protein [Pseudomonadota bacterium]